MQVREYLKLGVVQNAVNLPSLSHEEYVKLAPYIDLAGRLGSFLAQAGKSGIEAIHLIYGGALAEAKTELVRNAAIAGLLQGSENVNRINAAAVAQERGIRVHEEKEESHRGGAATVLTVVLHTAQGESRASATVIHGEQPRLLEFDGIDIEAPLEGNLLVCRNLDVPGVIGRIGTILGRAGREHRQLCAGPRARRRKAGEGAGGGAGRRAGGTGGPRSAEDNRSAARSTAGKPAGRELKGQLSAIQLSACHGPTCAIRLYVQVCDAARAGFDTHRRPAAIQLCVHVVMVRRSLHRHRLIGLNRARSG